MRSALLDGGHDGVPDERRKRRRRPGDELGVPVEVVPSGTAAQLVGQVPVEVEVVPAEGLDHGLPRGIGGEPPAAAGQGPAARAVPDQAVRGTELEE